MIKYDSTKVKFFCMFYLQQTSTCNISLSTVLRTALTVKLVIFTHSVQLDHVMMHVSCTVDLEPKAGQNWT